MPAHLIVNVSVTGSPAELAEYRERVGATVEPYGGRYLVRSSNPDILEGEWAADQVVLVQFPDLDAARAGTSRRSTGRSHRCGRRTRRVSGCS